MTSLSEDENISRNSSRKNNAGSRQNESSVNEEKSSEDLPRFEKFSFQSEEATDAFDEGFENRRSDAGVSPGSVAAPRAPKASVRSPRNQSSQAQDQQRQGTHSRQTAQTPAYFAQTQADKNEHVYKKKRVYKKQRKGLKITAIVLAVIVLLLGGVGVASALYMGSVADSISYKGDSDELKAALTESSYQEPYYILVIGSDNWEGYGARSDAMILTRIDLNTTTVTMVSVPRDTPYQINGQTVKLNQVFAEQGEVACVEAVSELTGVPISHYVELEFDQLEEVVDSLGGVFVNVPYQIDYTVYTQDKPTVHIDAGPQVLDGEQAVALARMRTGYEDVSTEDVGQDAIRQANIRAMMIAAVKQILNKPVSEIPGSIQTLAGMVVTDIPMTTLVDWAMKFSQAPQTTVYSCTGPTAGDIDDETGLWLTYEAPEAWKTLMDVVDSGADPKNALKSDSGDTARLQATEVIDNQVS